jgi:hypothetical protein
MHIDPLQLQQVWLTCMHACRSIWSTRAYRNIIARWLCLVNVQSMDGQHVCVTSIQWVIIGSTTQRRMHMCRRDEFWGTRETFFVGHNWAISAIVLCPSLAYSSHCSHQPCSSGWRFIPCMHATCLISSAWIWCVFVRTMHLCMYAKPSHASLWIKPFTLAICSSILLSF